MDILSRYCQRTEVWPESQRKKRIFFSNNLQVAPNFLLPLRRIFEPNENGRYLAKIKDVFYTMEDCKKAMKKYRGGLPVVYNTIRYPETLPSFLASENSVAQDFDREQIIKNEVQKRVVLLRNQICDLTEECIDLTMNKKTWKILPMRPT